MNAALANHLWQSTVFAGGVFVTAFMLRQSHARIRYVMWLAASVKFLIPFALLMGVGATFVPRTAHVSQPSKVVVAAARTAEPFASQIIQSTAVVRAASRPHWSTIVFTTLWAFGFITIVIVRVETWKRLQTAVRRGRDLNLSYLTMAPVLTVRAAPGLLEPAVIGFWRPMLILPADVEEYLTEEQLEAVVAHEMCHAKRRDNLTAAIHMLVEALLWFYPLVWWIGARLLDERERACDEYVLSLYRAPKAYAEGILRICQRCVDSPTACVAGVGGANLRKRIEAIVANRVGQRPNLLGSVALTTLCVAALTLPVFLGAQQPVVPSFEVATVKTNTSADTNGMLRRLPGGRMIVTNMPVRDLIIFAYQLAEYQLSGGPGWIAADRFDIVAKVAGNPEAVAPGKGPDATQLALRALLAERFKLTIHPETRETEIYALVMAKAGAGPGPNLRPTKIDCAALAAAQQGQPPPPPGSNVPFCGIRGNSVSIHFGGLPVSEIAVALAVPAGRRVVDRTGLTGNWDFDLTFAPEQRGLGPGGAAAVSDMPSFFTAVQEQLGLKLESAKGAVDVVVIDRIERPALD